MNLFQTQRITHIIHLYIHTTCRLIIRLNGKIDKGHQVQII